MLFAVLVSQLSGNDLRAIWAWLKGLSGEQVQVNCLDRWLVLETVLQLYWIVQIPDGLRAADSSVWNFQHEIAPSRWRSSIKQTRRDVQPPWPRKWTGLGFIIPPQWGGTFNFISMRNLHGNEIPGRRKFARAFESLAFFFSSSFFLRFLFFLSFSFPFSSVPREGKTVARDELTRIIPLGPREFLQRRAGRLHARVHSPSYLNTNCRWRIMVCECQLDWAPPQRV